MDYWNGIPAHEIPPHAIKTMEVGAFGRTYLLSRSSPYEMFTTETGTPVEWEDTYNRIILDCFPPRSNAERLKGFDVVEWEDHGTKYIACYVGNNQWVQTEIKLEDAIYSEELSLRPGLREVYGYKVQGEKRLPEGW